ncbi:3-carboxymuconate cyclase [Paenibacillus odorifer]|uniref:lactonase family protein n=1 Tax=Paenibacillus TaxID=44249 RepID=UPI0003E295E8|nr:MULTISPECIES: lactonase family protein [Paenibacillus]ETT49469.1 6-phosphogluconolactonase 6-P-gluconolactonase [Paenibacillus sp. FSL H8-237]OME33888.1 3-carboxymuconate cyclase [Paenibacillus odorifer]OME39066.1 3-carboxymuconate cyclase [Paenibacillus odorifer]OME63195.1 3-carboxymuconate cyclase [Paenibacillus odorifer]
MNEQNKLLLFTGSYASAAESGVQVFEFDGAAGGTLKLLDSVQGLTNPTFVNVDAAEKRLYAIGEKPNDEGGKEGEVISFAIDLKDGKLSELKRIPSMPASGNRQTTTCHINRDLNDEYVVVCSYHGGSVGLIKLNEDKAADQLVDVAVHSGHGQHPERQDRPHPHSAIFSPDGQYVFVSDLGLDLIRAYRINRETNKLEVHGDTALHPGAGPRHFTFHPDGKSAYVINEVDSTITSFTYDSAAGTLHTVDTVPTLPDDFDEENTCAEIAISKDGKYLYASNRGADNIAVYAVDNASAKLTHLEYVSTRGGHPRHFALTPDGAYLIVANRDANNLVVFSIEAASGRLEFTGNTAEVSKPVCVKPVIVPA